MKNISVIAHKIRNEDGPVQTSQQPGKEYIVFITEGNPELTKAAMNARSHLDEILEQSGSTRAIEIMEIPDLKAAIEFWKNNPLAVPLVVADTAQDASGHRFKQVQFNSDPLMVTGVINPYTVRTDHADVGSQTDELVLESVIRTLALELKEMSGIRAVAFHNLGESRIREYEAGLRQRIADVVEKSRDYMHSGKQEPLLPPVLIRPEVTLTAIIMALKDHYGKRNHVSRETVDAAKNALHQLLETAPPGVLYLIGKEGAYMLTTTLEGSDETAPAKAIKAFEKHSQARHVDSLSRRLRQQTEDAPSQTSGRFSRFKTPATYWPLKVDGYSVLLMDAIRGCSIVDLMPKLNGAIEKGGELGENAKLMKGFIFQLALNDLVDWQEKSLVLSQEDAYEPEPTRITHFVRTSWAQSVETLERLTNVKLTENEKAAVERAGEKMAQLVSQRYALGLDAGPRNIIIETEPKAGIEQIIAGFSRGNGRKEVQIYDVANALGHVDLPYEWRTIHELRDAVRLLMSPASGLLQEEAERFFAYFVLRKEYLRAGNDTERRADASIQISALLDKGEKPEGLELVARYFSAGPHDLTICTAAEAARMTVSIPSTFLRKLNAQMNGEQLPLGGRDYLEAKFRELERENRLWAAVGKRAIGQLAERSEGNFKYDFEAVASVLQQWQDTSIQRDRLQPYRRFANV